MTYFVCVDRAKYGQQRTLHKTGAKYKLLSVCKYTAKFEYFD